LQFCIASEQVNQINKQNFNKNIKDIII
jgi:hypothetical protein